MQKNIYLNKVNLFKELKPIMYKLYGDENKFIFATSDKSWEMSDIEGKEFIKDNVNSYNRTYINCHCFHCFGGKNDPHKNLKECLDMFIEEGNQLKELTNNKINLFITGKPTHTALKLFFELNGDEFWEELEKVDYEESKWINDSTLGSFVFCDQGYNGQSYKYDKNSFYPWIMTKDFYVPIGKGEYRKFNNSKIEKLGVGIYRCKISGDINHKLFKINDNNCYTHIDIKRALELDYNVELMQDIEYNAIVYNNEKRIKASKIFKRYVEYLYNFKQNKDKPSAPIKTILNCLWGVLCKDYKKEFYLSNEEIDTFEIFDNKEIVDILPYRNGYKLTIVDKNNLFNGAIPRLKPFLLAYGRYFLSQEIEKIGPDNIIRAHTDSVLLKEDVYLNVSNNIGDWKYEGEKYIEIKNMRSK